MTALRVAWVAGPPPCEGLWWVVWDGVASVVGVSPAVANPGGRLLLKTLDGVAYPLAENAGAISHHAALVAPAVPARRRAAKGGDRG